jgi:hypothetical protein
MYVYVMKKYPPIAETPRFFHTSFAQYVSTLNWVLLWRFYNNSLQSIKYIYKRTNKALASVWNCWKFPKQLVKLKKIQHMCNTQVINRRVTFFKRIKVRNFGPTLDLPKDPRCLCTVSSPLTVKSVKWVTYLKNFHLDDFN